MNPSQPFDLLIGLDRSDRKADLHFIETPSNRTWTQSLSTRPEDLAQWVHQLRQLYPSGRIALCLEQPAANLLLFLEGYDFITLFAINPVTLQKFREAFVTSRAKDDQKDAQFLARARKVSAKRLVPARTERRGLLCYRNRRCTRRTSSGDEVVLRTISGR